MNIKTPEMVIQAIDAVIARNPSWLQFYGENIKRGELDQDQVARADEAEGPMVAAAIAEAGYAAAMWRGRIAEARQILDAVNENTARVDTLLAGWHSIWHGAALEYEGDIPSASLAYSAALNRLGSGVALMHIDEPQNVESHSPVATPFVARMDRLVCLTSANAYGRELDRIRSSLRNLENASPRQMEEAVRALGEYLGFKSSRPDNDLGTGPDVLWLDDVSRSCIAIELKTDKKSDALYWKRDITQGHDHLEWVADTHKEYLCNGLLYVGPSGELEQKANPTQKMWLCNPTTLVEIRDDLLALIGDLRRMMPLERSRKAREAGASEDWTMPALFRRLCGHPMKDLPRKRA